MYSDGAISKELKMVIFSAERRTTGALIGIGALIKKNTFGGRLLQRGSLIGRRALNQTIKICIYTVCDINIL